MRSLGTTLVLAGIVGTFAISAFGDNAESRERREREARDRQSQEAAELAARKPTTEKEQLEQLFAAAWSNLLEPPHVAALLQLVDARYHYAQRAGLADLRVRIDEPLLSQQMEKLPLRFRLLWKAPGRTKVKFEGLEQLPAEARQVLEASTSGSGLNELGKLFFDEPLAEQAQGRLVLVLPDIHIPNPVTLPFSFMYYRPFYLQVVMVSTDPNAKEPVKCYWIDPNPDPLPVCGLFPQVATDIHVAKSFVLTHTESGFSCAWTRPVHLPVLEGLVPKHLVVGMAHFSQPFVDDPFPLSVPETLTLRAYAPFPNLFTPQQWVLSGYAQVGAASIAVGFSEHRVNQGISEAEMAEPAGPRFPAMPALPVARSGAVGSAAETERLYRLAVSAAAGGDAAGATRLLRQLGEGLQNSHLGNESGTAGTTDGKNGEPAAGTATSELAAAHGGGEGEGEATASEVDPSRLGNGSGSGSGGATVGASATAPATAPATATVGGGGATPADDAAARLESLRTRVEAAARALAARLHGTPAEEQVLRAFAAAAGGRAQGGKIGAAATATAVEAGTNSSIRASLAPGGFVGTLAAESSKAAGERERAAALALGRAREMEADRRFGPALRGYRDTTKAFPETEAGRSAGLEARRLGADGRVLALVERECAARAAAVEALVEAKLYERALRILDQELRECPREECLQRTWKRKAQVESLR
ncbi:MAG: hypothetical protein HYZ53_17280 [Planctomycetes bacterium]|nr:hypothetical protein [Planctomycetota bacterium]